MASLARTIKLPACLAEATEMRAARLKYPSTNAYWIALARFDLMVQGDHPVTLPIAQSRPEERDKVDTELLELTHKGVGIRGEFMVGLLKQIAAGQFQTPEEVGEELVRILAKSHSEKK